MSLSLVSTGRSPAVLDLMKGLSLVLFAEPERDWLDGLESSNSRDRDRDGRWSWSSNSGRKTATTSKAQLRSKPFITIHPNQLLSLLLQSGPCRSFSLFAFTFTLPPSLNLTIPMAEGRQIPIKMSAAATFDYYVELQVERSASLEHITSAYRRLARVHHPDRNHSNEQRATIAFQRLQQAYETLSDPVKRDRYDHPQTNNNEDDVEDDDDVIYHDYGYQNFHFPYHTNPYYGPPPRGPPFGIHPLDREGLWDFLFNRTSGVSYGRYSNFEQWEREMERREQAAAQLEADYRERVRVACAERKAREEQANAQQEAKRAAKQAAQDAKLSEMDAKRQEEAQLQEQRWKEANAVTKDEKLLSCLHSDYCRKIDLRKKVKCISCSAKRGMMAFECPHCLVHLCQLCVTNFSARRQRLKNSRVETTSTPPGPMFMEAQSDPLDNVEPERPANVILEVKDNSKSRASAV